MRLTCYALLLLVSASLCSAQTSATTPFVGTWKLNAAKSKFLKGPALKAETLQIAATRVDVDSSYPNGQSIHWGYAVGGGPSPVPIEGFGDGATVSETIEGNTVHHVWKVGTGTETGHGALSKDGKVMKYELTGTNEKGEPVHHILVFERQ